jgi:hypothetical protein
LFAVLFVLGISLPGVSLADMASISVTVQPLTAHGGVACHEDFREVPGNAQHLCPEHEGPLVVLAASQVPECLQEALAAGKPRTRAQRAACPATRNVVNVLAHEVDHLVRGVDHGTPVDPFREDLAMRAGCRAAYIPGWCETWIATFDARIAGGAK